VLLDCQQLLPRVCASVCVPIFVSDRNEKEAYLEWRRAIAAIEEGQSQLTLTPFERNIEVADVMI
jgi:hypothetical protein